MDLNFSPESRFEGVMVASLYLESNYLHKEALLDEIV